MTQRIKGITVALSHDIREDDMEHILNAISMIRGVNDVTPIPNDPNDFIVKSRVKEKVISDILEIFKKL